MKRWRIAVAAAALVLASACGSSGGESGDGGDPVSGGTLTINVPLEQFVSMDPVSFQPLAVRAVEEQRGFAVFDFLVALDRTTNKVEPRIAESLETADDGASWTLKIRDGVAFSDGTPYDAEAVKFNWERYADPALNSPALNSASEIASMEVVDPLTLKVTLKEANGQFPRIVASRLTFIGSPTAIQADPEGFASNPVGAGPFVMESWTRDSSMVLNRNDDYWSDAPYLDTVKFNVVTDWTQSFNALSTGGADMMHNTDFSVLASAESAGYEIQSIVPGGGRALVYNFTAAPFDNPKLREAINIAVDPEQYREAIAFGGGEVPESLFPEDSPFHDAEATYPSYDADRAQQLINEVAAETGGPVKFTITAGAGTQTHGEWFQAQLAGYDNLEVDVNISSRTYFTDMYTQNYDAIIWGIPLDDPEPDLYGNLYTGSVTNVSGLSDPEIDAALDLAHGSTDESVRAEAYSTVQQRLIDLDWALWYARFDLHFIHTDKVKGFETISDGVPRLDKIWLAQ